MRSPTLGVRPVAGRDAGRIRVRGVHREPLESPLAGYSLDYPRADTPVEGYDFVVQGWVTSGAHPPTGVELMAGGRVIERVAVDVRRPDIAELFPGIEWAVNSGFRTRVSVLQLPSEFQLEVRAVLQDATRHRLGTIEGVWQHPAVDTTRFLQPILLTTLGRTGSTWATRLLGAHDEILAYRPFEYEPRLASYWLEALGGLSHPHSYGQALRGDLSGDAWWLGRRASGRPTPSVDSAMARWLGTTQVEALLPFCVDRIESFYREAAERDGAGRAAFFVEKYSPSSFVPDLMWSLYPGTAEVILVRDFRDMICSIFAYNRKRGMQAFGRDLAHSDADYVAQLRTSGLRLLERWRCRSERAFLLRYEELVRDPEPVLAALFEHMGVDHDPATVREVVEAAARATPDAQRQHATTPDPTASIGRWRRDLTPELQRATEEAFSDILLEFGYEV